MEQTDLLKFAIGALQQLEISYALVGSFASGAWGESRFTQDIDIVVDLRSVQVGPLCAAFPEPDFYVSRTAAQEAVQQTGQFNVIHPASGNKIDFFIAGSTPWANAQLQRCKRVTLLPEVNGNIAAPEDVILGKLLYYQQGGSEKHVRDITGIMKISGHDVDWQYLEHFAEQLGVGELWRQIVERIESQ